MATVLVGLAMAVGIVGIIVPVLPGLGLVLAAGVVYGFVAGWNLTAYVAVALMTVLLVLGTLAKYVLADRSSTRGGAPRSSLRWGVLGAVIGFFAIPVVGLLVGGIGAIAVAEHTRLGSWPPAWQSTRATLYGIGTGMVVEVVAGVLMAMTWLLWVLLS